MPVCYHKTMQILTRGKASQGPADWFTGQVYIENLKPVSGRSKLSISSVHFTPGSRSAWHSHPNGQTLYVTEGIGVIQRRGGPVEIIRPGDMIWTEPGEEHWHGAAADHSMTHLAMQDTDDSGNFAVWGDKVTDEEYGKQPRI